MSDQEKRPDIGATQFKKEQVPMASVVYDNQDMFLANTVTITFNLDNVSRMQGGIGADFILGRMERIRNDLAAIIFEKQALRAKLANPAGPIQVAPH
jgi:hypothetical protein